MRWLAVIAAAPASEEMTTIPQALVNTALGMGTVFVVLILISFIISLLKYIPKLLELFTKKEAAPVPVSPVPKAAPQPKAEPRKMQRAVTEDTQLVAVIAAAVAAAMSEETGVPVAPDGLVIRSIRRRG